MFKYFKWFEHLLITCFLCSESGNLTVPGSGVVHLTGGVSGLAGTVILGPRKGRFTNPEEFECHNLPLVVLGTFALWFGWYGFNPGSTLTMKSGSDGALAAQVAMNTTLAAATGGITVFMLRYFIMKKYDVGALCNGILAGLVSITAGCGNMESGSAFATGLIGAFVYQAASMLLQKLHIDDPVDASPVHGFCGAWGVIAAGLFDWGRGIDHYHGWSGFGCMENDDGGCKTGIGGPAIGAQFIMVPWKHIASYCIILHHIASYCIILHQCLKSDFMLWTSFQVFPVYFVHTSLEIQRIPKVSGADDHSVSGFPVQHRLLRAEDDWSATHQRGSGRGRDGLAPSFPTKGLCFGFGVAFSIQNQRKQRKQRIWNLPNTCLSGLSGPSWTFDCRCGPVLFLSWKWSFSRTECILCVKHTVPSNFFPES